MSIPVVSSRTQGQISLPLQRNGPVPNLPYELREHIAADAWASRLPHLIHLCSRYNRPVLEGIWFILMCILMIVVPAAVHGAILHSFKQKMTRADALSETHFVLFAIAIAILLLFAGPHITWKFMGQKRATELVKQWEAEDAHGRSPGTFVPVWSVKLAGYLSSHSHLTITIPNKAAPSYFHPAAYMPSWINGPADSGATRGVPPTYQGFPPQGTYGDVPRYGSRPDLGLPPYVGGDVPVRPYSEEKFGPRV